MDGLEHLLMPSALFFWHIRVLMVVAGRGKILSVYTQWCGRVCADLSELHSPWRVVEDMAFPTFLSHLDRSDSGQDGQISKPVSLGRRPLSTQHYSSCLYTDQDEHLWAALSNNTLSVVWH